MTSPFGQYAPIVAVFASGVIILAHVGSLMIQGTSQLGDAFLLSLGAIFGSVATVNGVKPEVKALHRRLDALYGAGAAAGAGAVAGAVAGAAAGAEAGGVEPGGVPHD